MGQTLPPRTLCLRIRQLTAPPRSHEHECYELSLIVTASGEQIFFVNLELTYRPPTSYRTNSTSRFTYRTLSPGDNLSFIFSRTDTPTAIELARLLIPLEWFPPDSQIAESFHMTPIGTLPIIPILFLDVHHNLTSPAACWSAPYGIISPRQQPVTFAAESGSREFLGSVTFPVMAVSDQNLIISIPPTIEAKPIPEMVVADFRSRVFEWASVLFQTITEVEVRESEDDSGLKITDGLSSEDFNLMEQEVGFWQDVTPTSRRRCPIDGDGMDDAAKSSPITGEDLELVSGLSFFPTAEDLGEDHRRAPPLPVNVDF